MVLEYNSVYDELAQFLASLSPRRVIAYKASPKGTIKLLELNQPNKIEERYEMTLAGFYP
jgi:hypothetical protein